MNFKNVLVTGGAGFIGCALSQVLGPLAESWVVMDSMHPQVHESPSRPPELHTSAKFHVADVTSPRDWDRVLKNFAPDLLIHLAAETGTGQSLDEATRHAHVNVVGTSELMDALGRHKHLPQHVILASSRAVYGEGNWERTTGEIYQPGSRSHAMLESRVWDFPSATALPSSSSATIPNPTSVYGATKLAQENLLRAWGESREVAVSILRLQNVYGVGQSLNNPYTGIVSLFSQVAMRGEAIPVYEDGQIVRDFVYIDDVVDALTAVVNAGPNRSRPVLDIGAGKRTTIAELASLISNYHDAPEPIVTGLFRDGDVRFAMSDIAATRESIEWTPRVPLEKGIRLLQEWISEKISDSSVKSLG